MSEEKVRKRPRPSTSDDTDTFKMLETNDTGNGAGQRSDVTNALDPATSGSVVTTAAPLQLLLRDGVTLKTNACVLSQASPVLRETLQLRLARPGVLELPEDDAEPWQAALQMISLQVYPMDVVTWENVESLLILADKYDIMLVRHTCADFLSRRAPEETSLSLPLKSARNPLKAVSLVDSYCSGSPSLEKPRTAVHAALVSALAPLRPETQLLSSSSACKSAVQVLDELSDGLAISGKEGFRGIEPNVQEALVQALISGLRGIVAAPPTCGKCSCTIRGGDSSAISGPLHHACAKSLYDKYCSGCFESIPADVKRYCQPCVAKKGGRV